MSRYSDAAAARPKTLMELIVEKNWTEASALLDDKTVPVNVNERDSRNRSPLVIATLETQPAIIKKILERDPEATKNDLGILKKNKESLQEEARRRYKAGETMAGENESYKIALCDFVAAVIERSMFSKFEIAFENRIEYAKELLKYHFEECSKGPAPGGQNLNPLETLDRVKYSLTIKTEDGHSPLQSFAASLGVASPTYSSLLSKFTENSTENPKAAQYAMSVLTQCSTDEPLSPRPKFDKNGLQAGRVATNLELALAGNDLEHAFRLIEHGNNAHDMFSSQQSPLLAIVSNEDLEEKTRLDLVKRILDKSPEIPPREREILIKKDNFYQNTAERFLNSILRFSSQLKFGKEAGKWLKHKIEVALDDPSSKNSFLVEGTTLEEFTKYAITIKSPNDDGTTSSALDHFKDNQEVHPHLLDTLDKLTVKTSRDQGEAVTTQDARAAAPDSAPKRPEEDAGERSTPSPLSGAEPVQSLNL